MINFDRERLKVNSQCDFAFAGSQTFWFEKKEDLLQNPSLFDENEF